MPAATAKETAELYFITAISMIGALSIGSRTLEVDKHKCIIERVALWFVLFIALALCREPYWLRNSCALAILLVSIARINGYPGRLLKKETKPAEN
jgi:hypothetical protein